jgi:hypothetical protein
MENILFSVIIVSYKKLDILINCLNSIDKYNDIGDKLEIIVVDNSPEDNIYNYIKSNYKNVRILKSENRGFGASNNLGAKIARGKYLLFLNPDTVLIEPIFQFAIKKFEENNNLALFGIKLLDKNLKRNWPFAFVDGDGFLRSRIIKLCLKMDFFIEGKMYIAGADIFIRKKVFYDIGMFDENIFMYGEEADLARRIKVSNYKTKYFKDKSLIHLGGATVSNKDFVTREMLRSTKYLCKKYNISFDKKVLQKIRYQKFKYFVYRIFRREKCKEVKHHIEILKEYYKAID